VSQLIGVYGSLRTGGSNHPRLRPGAPAVPHAILKIPGRLYSLGDYCCAVPLADSADGEILAEIYEVDDHVFGSLDAMEREFGYVAIETTAAGADGVSRTFIVWYHLAVPDGATRVDGGDWVAYCQKRKQRY
jgi:gamma-glutamylcyclotransferase (GGCT)/AIG2-like uncharacterized protein YtfP